MIMRSATADAYRIHMMGAKPLFSSKGDQMHDRRGAGPARCSPLKPELRAVTRTLEAVGVIRSTTGRQPRCGQIGLRITKFMVTTVYVPSKYGRGP